MKTVQLFLKVFFYSKGLEMQLVKLKADGFFCNRYLGFVNSEGRAFVYLTSGVACTMVEVNCTTGSIFSFN